MNTPIADFVKNYTKSNFSRLHMPGHKGVSLIGCESLDITEIKGADELYSPSGIIRESESNASKLFNTERTVYSAGGSSQSINAMLYLAFLRAEKKDRPFVLAGRNAHKSFIYALAKLDCDVEWIYPQNEHGICRCTVTADVLRKRLKELEHMPFAVYITSPDYLGGIADIAGLSAVCGEYNIPLLVDNAHGAYLAFTEEKNHPILMSADMCCDSAHKTLPVLTGGGYLHIAKGDKYGFSKDAVRATEIFGSTSPSYLILQSLDLCNRYIDEKICEDIKFCRKKCDEIRLVMKEKGISDISDEPLKITADLRGFTPPLGGFSEYFRSCGIEPEYGDGDFAVFMVSPFNYTADFEKLKEAFRNLNFEAKARSEPMILQTAKRAMTVREAVFSQCETVKAENSLGRICASPTVSCPPAVPIAVSGEVINENHIILFKHYKTDNISVVQE